MNAHTLIIISGWAHTSSALHHFGSIFPSGFSVKTTDTYNLWTKRKGSNSPYVEGLIALLEETGGKPIVAGWSMGGMVALKTAAQRPDLISAIVMISACARFCADPDFTQGAPVSHVRAMENELKQDKRNTLKRFFKQAAKPVNEPPDILKKRLAAASSINDAELTHGLRFIREFDIRNDLHQIKVPVLALHGEEDRIISWHASKFLCDHIPFVRFKLYAQCGHNLPIHNPEPIASEIAAFSREIAC